MDYRIHPAPPDLAHVVRFFWTLGSDAPGDAPHRLTAETCPNLVFITRGGFTEANGTTAPQCHLAGALGTHADMVAHGPFRLTGVYLWPWSTTVLFGLAPEVCIGRFIDAHQLDPTFAGHGDDAPIEEIASWLHDRMDGTILPPATMRALVQRILVGTNAVAVEELIAQSGLARRQFERRFKECTGFPPALFLRIARFQHTYRMLENGTANSLTEVAIASGYFDQSHFIRDFKRFSGLNPRHYFMNAPDKADNFVRLG